MCDPTALAIGSLVIGVGSQVSSAAGRKREAKAEREAAQTAFLGTISDLTARLQEERTVSALQVEDIRREGSVNAALARASAGESGVSGISLDLLLGDIDRQVGEATGRVGLQQRFTEAQLRREAEAALAGRESRINQAQGPNFFNEALKIGGLGLGTVTDIVRRRSPA